MKILTSEAKNWLKRSLICRFVGHIESDWQFKYWEISHSHGRMVRVCERCGKEIENG